METVDPNYYALLGVEPGADIEVLRKAYRRKAMACHPDVSSLGTVDDEMVSLNEAWNVLSNLATREVYDSSLTKTEVPLPQPAPQSHPSRRLQWVLGVQAQIVRLGHQSGRSATQTLLLKAPLGGRSEYDVVVESIVRGLSEDTEARVRSARAAGVAPLDLGVGATLIGVRCLADKLKRQATTGVDQQMAMAAALLDRMWDILAYELPAPLPQCLGGNPHISDLVR